MKERFTIRLSPKIEESLSGYLIRVSEENGISLLNIIKIISSKIGSNEIRMDRPYMLDTIPISNEFLTELSLLTGKDKILFSNMTLSTVYLKMFERTDRESGRICGITDSIFIKDKRRFCKTCLKEYGFYKLIWQISDIEICNIHRTKLVTTCPKCYREQPYFSDKLGKYKCDECGEDLYDYPIESSINEKDFEKQLKMYNNWYSLLNSETPMINQIEGMSKEKSLALTFLYIANLEKKKYSLTPSGRKFWNSGFYYILHLILDMPQATCITVKRLIDLLDCIGMDLSELRKTVVPDDFIESVFNYYNKQDIESGECYSHWCLSYMTNNSMRQIKSDSIRKDNYSHAYVCTGCYIQYGYNKMNGNWESIKGFGELISKVIISLKKGNSKNGIMRELSISKESVNKALGYIASHNLMPKDLVLQYKPQQIPNDILEKFSDIIRAKGSMRKAGKRLFDWTISEFYYFLALDEVQDYLLFDLYKLRKKIYKIFENVNESIRNEMKNLYSENDVLNVENVAKKLEVSSGCIQRAKLTSFITEEKSKFREEKYKETKALIDNFFIDRELNMDKVCWKDIYKLTGKSYYGLMALNPELTIWISEKLKSHNIKRLDYINNEKIKVIKNSIYELHRNGIEITIANISKKSGLSINQINNSKIIRDAIDATLNVYQKCGLRNIEQLSNGI